MLQDPTCRKYGKNNEKLVDAVYARPSPIIKLRNDTRFSMAMSINAANLDQPLSDFFGVFDVLLALSKRGILSFEASSSVSVRMCHSTGCSRAAPTICKYLQF